MYRLKKAKYVSVIVNKKLSQNISLSCQMKGADLFCRLNMGWPSQNQHIRTNENVQKNA